MKSLYKLITKTNLKSPIIAFPLVMPLIFLLLYSVGIPTQFELANDLINGNGGLFADNTPLEDLTYQAWINFRVSVFFVTILSVMTMQSGLMGFGINFIAIKKSVLIRRIGSTELEKRHVILAVMLYGLTLYVITIIWIFLMIILFSAIGIFYTAGFDGSLIEGTTTPDVKATAFGWISYVQWLKLFVATILMLYISYTIGMLFTSIAKDDQMYMGMAMMYFFLSAFIGGLMFPSDVPTWMGYASYVIPHGYLDPIYTWAGGDTITQFDAIAGIIVPIVIGTLALIGSVKLLKFD